MALNKIGNCLIFALALAEVTSWTIDLPEVRKYLFEKNKAEKMRDIQPEREYYSNIEPNSKHHERHEKYDDTAYAREYGYQSYMEKKVNSIVYSGSVYLEGLRRALLNYTRLIENCNRTETRNMTIPTNSTILPPSPSNSTNTTSRCREATRSSEHVRRLAQLALTATRELQDVAYSRKYKKGDPYDLSQHENELILKLAWFLDRIAHYTGYEPDPKEYLREPTTTTTSPSPPPPMFVDPSPELKERLMNCIKEKSDVPAVDRCRYPETLPPMLQMLIDLNENSSDTPTMPTPPTQTDATAEPSRELLIAADNRTPTFAFAPIFPSIMSPVRSKRSTLSMPKPEVLKRDKRADDPMLHFLKYYAKYKVWEGSNKNSANSAIFEPYEVKNHLPHSVQKRTIDNKSKYSQLPENPYQDLSNYVKHKHGVNYIDDHDQLDKIKASLEKMHKKPAETNNKLTKLVRNKRALKYEHDVDMPRESENPQKDISYYVKNKPGRNYNNDLVQAVQVRAGLEQVFNTGNIEVVRRYGSNFNPLVPAPFFSGVLRTMADF